MSDNRIVSWSIDLSVEWSDKPNKFVHFTTDDIPEQVAREIDKFLDAVESDGNWKEEV